jgi:hypothetical protein
LITCPFEFVAIFRFPIQIKFIRFIPFFFDIGMLLLKDSAENITELRFNSDFGSVSDFGGVCTTVISEVLAMPVPMPWTQ